MARINGWKKISDKMWVRQVFDAFGREDYETIKIDKRVSGDSSKWRLQISKPFTTTGFKRHFDTKSEARNYAISFMKKS